MTFSLLGRCPETGQLGIVVTTSDIAVGARVPHARAGVGVAATQNRTDPRLGPELIAELGRGLSAGEALTAVCGRTPHLDWRQLGLLDAQGRAAAHTGEHSWPAAGALAGDDCLALGNMLRSDAVLTAMSEGFTAARGRLPGRLLAGIAAGRRAGGESGRLRSAALLVVEREAFPLVDLRVDDNADPLGALEALWHAYEPQVRDFVTRALDPGELP